LDWQEVPVGGRKNGRMQLIQWNQDVFIHINRKMKIKTEPHKTKQEMKALTLLSHILYFIENNNANSKRS
jgi:hypothetical protein